MNKLLYRQSPALLTDLYQLTMAQGYWKIGADRKEAVFHLFFRRAPFRGAYALACGLTPAIEMLERFAFSSDDTAYLATLVGNDGKRLFDPGFLEMLTTLRLECNVHAVREGTVMFPHEPLLRVTGPLLQCQLLETALLNIVNFQTLIATKASRICRAAQGEPVLEFGLRRAHGVDGGISASRAAFIGGCAATSNVLAGKLFDIPVKGTHAHSWVMSFDDELEAFEAYARAMPNNCVFLVDTYDTRRGVERAVEVGRWLRSKGHEMVGIRLDSGDLTALSIDARRILDAGSFPDAAIVASNDLDEHSITELKESGATIAVWGVGTKLATAFDEPALGGVYKLAAIRDDARSPWHDRVKRSEQAVKTSNPGIQQVRRFSDSSGRLVGDVIYDEKRGIETPIRAYSLAPPHDELSLDEKLDASDLLELRSSHGELRGDIETTVEAREHAHNQLLALPETTLRFELESPHPVGLERRLHEAKLDLIRRATSD